MRNKLVIIAIVGGILLNSCAKDALVKNPKDALSLKERMDNTFNVNNPEKYLVKFANILSKATYERSDVRSFLKQEALKQFDKNYDVLYYLVKDEMISGTSFRDILVSYSSEESMAEIESNVPLLNILVPEIAIFDVKPENLDIEDKEIPVVVSREKTTTLYLNGKEEMNLKKGEIPDFHVFVVNLNSRVIAPAQIPNTKSNHVKSIVFKSPNFDGSAQGILRPKVKSNVSAASVGHKAITAFSFFNKDDGSIYQKAFQRDNIYYGITPTKQTGQLNRSVSEYIGFIEVNPKTYFKISDQKTGLSTNDDPRIRETTAVRLKKPFTDDELLDRMWTKGAYDFRFEIVRSTNDKPQIVYIPLKPNEIWNFNIAYHKRSSHMFRKSRHTHTIDPNNFTSKTVYLDPNIISLGKWDLATESIYRYVNVLEEDESSTKEEKMTYESIQVNEKNFKGDAKLSLGLGKVIISGDASINVDNKNTNTKREEKIVTINRKEQSDHLGSVNIYFYDPIILAKDKETYKIHTYNTGHISFGIFVK